jgi:Leucine-rich repeat (LRR) protein
VRFSNNVYYCGQALSYLPNLEELFLSGNHLQKLTDLHRCKKLQELDLSRNQLSDLSGISGLPSLQVGCSESVMA